MDPTLMQLLGLSGQMGQGGGPFMYGPAPMFGAGLTGLAAVGNRFGGQEGAMMGMLGQQLFGGMLPPQLQSLLGRIQPNRNTDPQRAIYERQVQAATMGIQFGMGSQTLPKALGLDPNSTMGRTLAGMTPALIGALPELRPFYDMIDPNAMLSGGYNLVAATQLQDPRERGQVNQNRVGAMRSTMEAMATNGRFRNNLLTAGNNLDDFSMFTRLAVDAGVEATDLRPDQEREARARAARDLTSMRAEELKADGLTDEAARARASGEVLQAQTVGADRGALGARLDEMQGLAVRSTRAVVSGGYQAEIGRELARAIDPNMTAEQQATMMRSYGLNARSGDEVASIKELIRNFKELADASGKTAQEMLNAGEVLTRTYGGSRMVNSTIAAMASADARQATMLGGVRDQDAQRAASVNAGAIGDTLAGGVGAMLTAAEMMEGREGDSAFLRSVRAKIASGEGITRAESDQLLKESGTNQEFNTLRGVLYGSPQMLAREQEKMTKRNPNAVAGLAKSAIATLSEDGDPINSEIFGAMDKLTDQERQDLANSTSLSSPAAVKLAGMLSQNAKTQFYVSYGDELGSQNSIRRRLGLESLVRQHAAANTPEAKARRTRMDQMDAAKAMADSSNEGLSGFLANAEGKGIFERAIAGAGMLMDNDALAFANGTANADAKQIYGTIAASGMSDAQLEKALMSGDSPAAKTKEEAKARIDALRSITGEGTAKLGMTGRQYLNAQRSLDELLSGGAGEDDKRVIAARSQMATAGAALGEAGISVSGKTSKELAEEKALQQRAAGQAVASDKGGLSTANAAPPINVNPAFDVKVVIQMPDGSQRDGSNMAQVGIVPKTTAAQARASTSQNTANGMSQQ